MLSIFQVYRFDIQLLVQLWVIYKTGIDRYFKRWVYNEENTTLSKYFEAVGGKLMQWVILRKEL